jgi:hypothetical protein
MSEKELPDGLAEVIKGIEAQIAEQEAAAEKLQLDATSHKETAERLKFLLKNLIENPPPRIHFIQENPKLGKEYVRNFMRKVMKPVRTVDVIEMCFPNADEETKSKQIKLLSVTFNTLVKDGTVKMEKQKGVKGNYYSWVEK